MKAGDDLAGAIICPTLHARYVFTKTINRKIINWTPTGHATHLHSGDKTFSREKKVNVNTYRACKVGQIIAPARSSPAFREFFFFLGDVFL